MECTSQITPLFEVVIEIILVRLKKLLRKSQHVQDLNFEVSQKWILQCRTKGHVQIGPFTANQSILTLRHNSIHFATTIITIFKFKFLSFSMYCLVWLGS